MNDDQTADSRDEDAKAAETSEEEALAPRNLAGAESGLDGLLGENVIVGGISDAEGGRNMEDDRHT